MTDRERLLDELRPHAFAIAYRMLGSVGEAEDIVQEALLRVHQALQAGEQIAAPRAYVATVTTRLAINDLRSARTRREHYVGEWLPEPIITDGHPDPAQQAEMADSLSLAMLVILESLSPEQRAVLLLHDVFDYPYPEIAAILGKNPDNVRQLATRARRHIHSADPGSTPPANNATSSHDDSLRPPNTATSPGSKRCSPQTSSSPATAAARSPPSDTTLHGRSHVARTLITWLHPDTRIPGVSLRLVEVNGGPGAIFLDPQQRLIGVWALDMIDGHIQSITPSPTPTNSPISDQSATSQHSSSRRAKPEVPAAGHRSRESGIPRLSGSFRG